MYNYLNEKVNIVNEINHVLNIDNIEDDCISLYDISLLYKSINNIYTKFSKRLLFQI